MCHCPDVDCDELCGGEGLGIKETNKTTGCDTCKGCEESKGLEFAKFYSKKIIPNSQGSA